MLIRELMTESVVTASRDATVRDVAELMRERNVGSVVISQDEVPQGFITDRDLTISVIADDRSASDCALDYASCPVQTITPDADVQDAAAMMIEQGIRRLVVVSGERLIGIVTLDDIAARTGDSELARQLSSRVTRAVLPDFYFYDRGEG